MSGEACMAAQISRFSTRLQRKMIKSFSEHIGGDAFAVYGQDQSLSVAGIGSGAAAVEGQ